MAVSGYLLFFKQHKNNDFYKTMFKRYAITFLFWYVLYVVFTYFTGRVYQDTTIINYIIENSDGWMYWYFEVLLAILIIFPIVKIILTSPKALNLYVVLWLIFISIRQSLALFVPSKYLDIIQLPFFQTKKYIGGTILAHYPTECLGVFVVLGYLIMMLKEGKVNALYKRLIILFGGVSFIAIMLGAKYCIYKGVAVDYVMQPVQVQIVFTASLFVLFFYHIYPMINNHFRRVLRFISQKSLGIYVVHPFVLPIVIKITGNFTFIPCVNTAIKAIVTILISLIVVIAIDKIIPKRISGYII